MGTQWIQIPRKFLELDKGTKFVDVLVYAAIDYQKDSSTYTSRIGQRTIAEKYNIPLSKVEDAIKRLKESGYIDYTQLPSDKYKDCVFNEYTFPLIKDGKIEGGYLKLKPLLIQNTDLKPKDRGILIYLQLIALPDMNDILETKIEDIADRLGICRQTASKYLKKYVASGQLNQTRNGIYQCKYLDKDIKVKDKKEIEIILC